MLGFEVEEVTAYIKENACGNISFTEPCNPLHTRTVFSGIFIVTADSVDHSLYISLSVVAFNDELKSTYGI